MVIPSNDRSSLEGGLRFAVLLGPKGGLRVTLTEYLVESSSSLLNLISSVKLFCKSLSRDIIKTSNYLIQDLTVVILQLSDHNVNGINKFSNQNQVLVCLVRSIRTQPIRV